MGMTLYSEKVWKHFEHPKNVGVLDVNDPQVGTGLAGAPECGSMIRLQIEVSPETQTIVNAKFKSLGCGHTIASSSLATEWLENKTLEEAKTFDHLYLVEELELSPVKLHCSLLAEDAVKAAIQDYLRKNADREVLAMNNYKLIN